MVKVAVKVVVKFLVKVVAKVVANFVVNVEINFVESQSCEFFVVTEPRVVFNFNFKGLGVVVNLSNGRELFCSAWCGQHRGQSSPMWSQRA